MIIGKKIAAALAMTATIVMMSHAHTESPLVQRPSYLGAKKGWFSQYKEAELNIPNTRVSRAQKGEQTWPPKKWKDIGDWDDKDYKGVVVEHGSYLGRPLFWEAKWWVTPKDVPGLMPDSGSTSGWKLLNSSAAGVQNPNPEWTGADLTPGSDAKVKLPTWQDGAKGAYALISDDIGAFETTEGYDELVDFAEEANAKEREYFGGYNAIRFGFGAQVDKSDDTEWEWMRKAVLRGHEILNHSYNHTSAASQWQTYYQDDATGDTLAEIDQFTGAAGDTIPISGICTGPDDPYVAHLPYVKDKQVGGKTIKFPHVGKDLPKWASGAIVLSPNGFANAPGTVTKYGNYEIKDTDDARYLKTNTKEWIDDTEPHIARIDCSVRMNDDEDKQDIWGPWYNGWDSEEFTLNVALAQDTINQKVYEYLNNDGHLKSPYFDDTKRVEFYVYPYDAYDSSTHAYLEENDYVGARGGSKGANCTPLDFFHPFRTDFDAHFDDDMGVYEDGNPHQYLTLPGMLDSIVSQKGFHTRETHTVTDKDNLGWGPIPTDRFKSHLKDLMGRIKKGDITMYTPSEAVKYRITRDNMTISVSKTGDKKWKITPDITLDSKYHEAYDDILITYAFTLPTGVTLGDNEKLLAKYTETGEYVRRNPWLREGWDNWCVYADPYKGPIEVFVTEGDAVIPNQKVSQKVAFQGVSDNKILLNLPAGNFQAKLYNATGRMIAQSTVRSNAGIVQSGIVTDNFSSGLYFLTVEKNGVALMKGQKLFIK